MHKIKYNRSKALHAFNIETMKSVGLGSSLSAWGEAQLTVPALEGVVLPYGVVHPGHGEEGSKVGRVGGAHDEGEEPPASHHDAHGHGVHGGLATWEERSRGWLRCPPAPSRTQSGRGASAVLGWGPGRLPAWVAPWQSRKEPQAPAWRGWRTRGHGGARIVLFLA